MDNPCLVNTDQVDACPILEFSNYFLSDIREFAIGLKQTAGMF